ncbi:HDOD domain-containing protein [bacterium]|nr:HDOD domain-containing protein [bacterium]
MVAHIDKEHLRALIVDDDSVVRKILKEALSDEGFECQLAGNGEHAADCMKTARFDLLVTDLCMPEKNGHALSVSVLEQEPRPVVLVHTGVTDPRIARDLMVRGVDDVVYKPADYAALAAKAWGLVKRRRAAARDRQTRGGDSPSPDSGDMHAISSDVKTGRSERLRSESVAAQAEAVSRRIPAREMQTRLSQLKSLVPLSEVAIEVYSLATQDAEADRLRDCIERDATLAAEVLKLVNSAYCSAIHRRIDSIDEAIIRLGRGSIGELALLLGVRQGLAGQPVPWLDRKLLWRRSMAAAIALRQFSALDSEDSRLENTLHLCALLHPVGRLALAAAFPDDHRELVERCQECGESLELAEQQRFGLTHHQVTARLATAWCLPGESRTLLEQVSRPFHLVERLPSELQHRVRRLKLAILIGQLATADWPLWDTVDVPAEQALHDAGIASLDETVAAVREQLDSIPESDPGPGSSLAFPKYADIGPVHYHSPVPEKNDTLRILFKLAGITLLDASSPSTRVTLVNAVSPSARRPPANAGKVRVVTAGADADVSDAAIHVALPASLHEILF